MNGIFDSHAHYDDAAFDIDREELLSSLPLSGVCAVVNCGADIASSRVSLELASKYDYIFAACGFHPHEASKRPKSWLRELEELCSEPKCVAVGEIGLDYHYDFSPREEQLEVLEQQLILANRLRLPVIIHDREAHEDTLTLLKRHTPRGVVHCFSGSVEMAREIVSIGMYIGLGGAVTFKNARRPLEVTAYVPEERLLIETDCPYMTPVPLRGTRCNSSLIPHTADVIANARGISTQRVLDVTRANACRLFGVTCVKGEISDD